LIAVSVFAISLDFELFWGVTDSRTIENYGANIEGVWQVIPAMLKLFKQYDIHATWATVGMLMCKDFRQWSDFRPTVMPTYARDTCSTYSFSTLAREFPELFFAPALVRQILTTEGQELASHTYSHFYCGENSTTIEQFAADLDCVKSIFSEYGVKPTSLVFPRNQIRDEYLKVLLDAGFTVYRGNQDHRLYRDGHLVSVPFGTAWRIVKIADTYLPLTGNHISAVPQNKNERCLVNIPASKFLRPASKYPLLDKLQINRVKSGMLEAAKTNGVFHLWWHPHNFGQYTEANIKNLEELLKYYQTLNQKYGLRSMSMNEVGGL
jgi:peptidoglycan/xylan/chitin deacetylase (PgdA/CDA1 family)